MPESPPAKETVSDDLSRPQLMLFDWHGTLVNTHEAMYAAIEDMLPQLEELGLMPFLRDEREAANTHDEKLIRYIRIFRHLHPRVLAEQRVSRTDIFDVLFADDANALKIAHDAYNEAYRAHYGKVSPFQAGLFDYLCYLKDLGIRIGVVTNRHREFFAAELERVDDGRWQDLFDVTLCGNEAARYKPAPDGLLAIAQQFSISDMSELWYVGDSVTDMHTAARAGATRIFYNGALWGSHWFSDMFANTRCAPQCIVNSFDALLDTGPIRALADAHPDLARPIRLAPPAPPPPRQEPDWHPALAKLQPPDVIIFDWHATLVDTLDAMYHAVDDMLKELREMQLLEHLVDTATCKNPEDERLVSYVKDNLSLHPKIKLDRKISRTDIFEVLFGDNQTAKQIAHAGFTKHYRNYFGTALPFEPKVRHVLEGLRTLGLPIGVITNRDREFLLHELKTIEDGSWADLFTIEICGDDTPRRKPHPDQIYLACDRLSVPPSPKVWYVGDSTTDVIAAKTAGITSVFFNGALWDLPWLNKIFPGNARFPHRPDVVVNDFAEFWALVLSCRNRSRLSNERAQDAP